ncbi:hypothetical protein [Catenovulum agarivorans]|uniref:hypothetical protein n=1 Tax=Catenovulum agarivorans TaxID=1172192 RepID=UPI0012F8F7F5|nr:hypothetical protein [Catenovulum agarivorans]
MMKKSLLVSAVLSALAGCSDDNSGIVNVVDTGENDAPTHQGNITVTLNERDKTRLVYLLGTTTGAKGGVNDNGTPDDTSDDFTNAAYDADGDYLQVIDVQSNLEDMTGFHIENGVLVVRAAELKPALDAADTRTMTLTYKISDGELSVERTATINVEGAESTPVFESGIEIGYTKATSIDELDLLMGVSDEDDETLIVSNLQKVGTHNYNLDASIVDGKLRIDLDSIKSQVPDEGFETFEYTYDIADRKNTLTRSIKVKYIAVEGVEGAPFFTEYFLETSLTENSNPTVVDLLQDVTDNDSEPRIKDFKVEGLAELPKGVFVEGNELTIVPAAYAEELSPSQSQEFNFSYQIEDGNGITAAGRRQLKLTIAGKNNNLMLAQGFNADFENVNNVGPVNDANTNNFLFGWANWNCPVKEIKAESARTGSYGWRLEGEYCHNEISSDYFVPMLEAEDKYVTSYWLRSEEANGPAGNPFVSIYAGPSTDGARFWNGTRLEGISLNEWHIHEQFFSGSSAPYSELVGNPIWLSIFKYAGQGKHDIDDLSLVRYSAFMHPMLDLIEGDQGLFDDSQTINSNGGAVELSDGQLSIDTTGSASGVTVSLPITANSVKTNSYYIVTFDAVRNGDLANDSAVTVKLTNGSESIMASGTVSNGMIELVMNELTTRSADVDWSQETMTLDITFTDADSTIMLDNVRLYRAPQ